MIRKIVIVVLSLSSLLCLVAPFGFYLYNQATPSPKPKWDHSADSIVLVIDRFRGEVDCDYLPSLQIKGNGQVLRVYNDDGKRHILETTLSEQNMEEVINGFIQANFFDNDTRYDSFPTVGDYIGLSLENNITHWVVLDENETVKILAEQLMNDIKARSKKFVPSEGVITVYQVDYELDPKVVIQPWPDEEFGYSLGEIIGEKKVLQGQDMLFAWNVRNSANRVVESDGKLYGFCITHE